MVQTSLPLVDEMRVVSRGLWVVNCEPPPPTFNFLAGWAYHILAIFDDILAYVYLAFTVVVLRNLRRHVRSKYSIPEGDSCPSGCEDVCCSMCCSCLVVGQMMRHTADYETYGARCCTDTGLPLHAPSIV
jgi:hypothetical protein